MWLASIRLKMKQWGVKPDWLFYAGYAAFLIGATVSYSVVPVAAMYWLENIGLGLMFLYMLYANRKSSWKVWLGLISAYLATLVIVRVSGTRLLLDVLVFITAFKDIDFNKFVKRDFVLRLGLVLIVVGLYAIGILDDSVRSRPDGVLRYALGFTHPNALSLQTVFLTLEFVYLNRNRKVFWSFVVVLATLIFNYKITNGRTAMMALVILLPFLLIPKRTWPKIFSNKYVGLFMKASFMIFLVIVLVLAFWYAKDNSIMRSINDVFSDRLTLAHGYLLDYGVMEPFGNNLYATDAVLSELPKVYRKALDIGYIHVLLRFGWIAILVWAITYWRAMGFLQENRNWTGMMALLVIAFYSMLETGTLFGYVDPFLPFFSVLFYGSIRGLRIKQARAKGDILLLTWAEGDNYGTALQSWCLKRVISNFGQFMPNENISHREVNVLNYHVTMDCVSEKSESGIIRKIRRFRDRSLAENRERWKFHMRKLKLRTKLQRREQLFQEFRQNELELFPYDMINQRKELSKLPQFKTYLVGSDQIWNPKLLDSTYLLGWAPKNSIKVSYGPSVCVDKIAADDLKKYMPLKNFSKLSVREYTDAVREISEYISKRIVEVVDPVVLYGRKALLKHCYIEKTNNYCFSYLLGSSMRSREYAKRFAKNNGLKLKAVTGVNKEHILTDEMLDDVAIWNLSPLGIINLVFNSRLVVTDSFHMLVICVLLHKQFVILPRENDAGQQNNRISGFLKKIKMEHILGYAPEKIEEVRFSSFEWALCDSQIEKERDKSLRYLAKALECSDSGKGESNNKRRIQVVCNDPQDKTRNIKVDYADEKDIIKIKIINRFRRKDSKQKQREKKIDIIINGQRMNNASKKSQKNTRHQARSIPSKAKVPKKSKKDAKREKH